MLLAWDRSASDSVVALWRWCANAVLRVGCFGGVGRRSASAMVEVIAGGRLVGLCVVHGECDGVTLGASL